MVGYFFFFFNDTATTEIYTLSLHDALPISYLNQMAFVHKASPMYLIGWGNTTWDADGTLSPVWRSGNPLANHYSINFDGMIDEAQTTVDSKRRLETYARAQRLMLDDGAVLPLYQQMDLYGVSRRGDF